MFGLNDISLFTYLSFGKTDSKNESENEKIEFSKGQSWREGEKSM
jgi:hypothetical protein